MTTRFQTRTFLLCFIPFSILFAGSYWMVQRVVQSMVRDGLHSSLHESQVAIAAIHAKGNLQSSSMLRAASESADLKAGTRLLLTSSQSGTVRKTVEGQLSELGERMGFDLMLVSTLNGSPLAGVTRRPGAPEQDSRGHLEPFDIALLYQSDSGFRVIGGRTFQIASIPIAMNDENIGVLSVGKYFDISNLSTPFVLIRAGDVIASNIPQAPYDELARSLAHCKDLSECDVQLQGSNWISLPVQSYGGGYVLLSLENVDKATAPIQSKLHSLFLILSLLSVVMALLCSVASSNSIVKPISAVVARLRKAALTGTLPELEKREYPILEIHDLAEFYNQAAVSVRVASENLESAYLEFVASLANALDARDQYTAGHSRRVSELSCAIASSLQLESSDIARIRVGALLHDIGKIGIADQLLQKRGRLTRKEAELLKQHPVIGRRILESVQGFAPFLSAVELHHENWDGSGYPHGLSAEQIPIDARIIQVADAYDAMTTSRPYRRGLTHDEAVSELIECAGLQFDPQIVEVFVCLPREVMAPIVARQKVQTIRPMKDDQYRTRAGESGRRSRAK